MFLSCVKHLTMAVAVIALLSACATAPETPDTSAEDIARSEQLAGAGDYELAAQVRLNLAQRSSGTTQQEHAMEAARLAWQADNVELTERALYLAAQTPWSTANGEVEYRELLSRVRLRQGDVQAAYDLLPTSLSGVSQARQISILLWRAEVLEANNKPFTSIRQRVAVDRILASPEAQANNHQNIWSLIRRQTTETLTQWSGAARNIEVKGWMDLGYLTRSTALSLDALERALASWRRAYPQHPAETHIIPQLTIEWATFSQLPERIAVILPLTGRLASVGEAVADGMQLAMYHAPASERPQLRFIDQGDEPAPILLQYQTAQEWDADIVIGPLLDKTAAETLANQLELPIPVLSLTYLDERENTPNRFYQFGLLPEDEARQAADRAMQQQHGNALILTPDTDWGARMAEAFEERFTELGGKVLLTEVYASQANDHRQSLKRALGIFQSEARERKVRSTIKASLEFEPRRRADIDVIFLAASPRQARLIQPQLKFHRAADLPILATSTINDGKRAPQINRDLNGIEFNDIPWLVQAEQQQTEFGDMLDDLPSNSQQRFPRLVALGIDSIRVLPFLNHLATYDFERRPGTTGELSVDTQGRLHRELEWATFSRGLMEPIVEPEQTGDDATP